MMTALQGRVEDFKAVLKILHLAELLSIP